MKYAVIPFILIPSIYTFSYAKHSWKAKNKPAAIGAALLATASIALPVMILMFKE